MIYKNSIKINLVLNDDVQLLWHESMLWRGQSVGCGMRPIKIQKEFIIKIKPMRENSDTCFVK